MADPGMNLMPFVQPPAGGAGMGGAAGGLGALFGGPWGAAAGIGLEFLGAQMAANQGITRRTQRRRGLRSLEQGRARDAVFGGLENAALLKGQAAERQGFKGARTALDLGANVARAGIQQRGLANQAATEQSVVSKGLLGHSRGAQDFAGVGNQTSMQLAALDAQLAQAFADLNLQEGALLGQQGLQRTALAAKNREMERAFGEAEFGLYTLA